MKSSAFSFLSACRSNRCRCSGRPERGRRRTAALLLAALLAVQGSAVGRAAAQTEKPQAVSLKVGYVDASRVLEQAPQAEQARQLLEREFGLRDKALVDAQRELRELEDRLASQGLTLSDVERRQLEQQIRTQGRELERGRQEFREDFNIRRNEELRKLQRLVYQTIVSLAEQEQYDLIVNDGAVIFAAPTVDLTEQILTRLSDGDPPPPAGDDER